MTAGHGPSFTFGKHPHWRFFRLSLATLWQPWNRVKPHVRTCVGACVWFTVNLQPVESRLLFHSYCYYLLEVVFLRARILTINLQPVFVTSFKCFSCCGQRRGAPPLLDVFNASSRVFFQVSPLKAIYYVVCCLRLRTILRARRT